ncbi:protein-tyrosine phosphatase family protein [Ancylobacter pratisalsi]|uniref:Tyrosine specific protein phosphatases domain-containing protein n=1 Tax=Ancylobacter pratisalsi TaxID=1745854 RepID=A0A6P1YRF0_9HYPH|nr:hypothetical protein [Ancylobacter pratisalsi]QIB34314.1 hypothetical protein G3A50_11780 [Ancylobacter pratisalsi]
MGFPDESDASSVRAICARPGGGRVITMGFPGLDTDPRGRAWLNPERLEATLDVAVTAGLRLLLILAQADELPEGAVAYVREASRARRVRALALPIQDYSVPGASFLRAWRRLAPLRQRIFADGQAVGVCCHHGAGRSGVVAAMHLIEAGVEPAAAVSALRAQFAETVENKLQYQWLERYPELLASA